MKKVIILIATLISFLASTAQVQTQQGYVKTKGRLVNGKLVPGQGIKGATVSIKGRTAVLVNADDGAFSFPVPGTQFRVDSVRKKGYQLVDLDALSKTYKHSTSPIYLVMETPEQQLQDQLTAERRIRRTLTNQIRQREDEIEALREQQRITDEEHQQALQELYEEANLNEQLVKDMVERYSTIDYDQLSEFDQRISELILNGELVKADSMICTKGDIKERVEQYRKHEAINAKEKEELNRRQASLKQNEIAVQIERDDIANDCYRKFEICKMQHENDSAAYYIELRAGLDSTNAEWQYMAGCFIQDYISDYETALAYFRLALRQIETHYGTNNEDAAAVYNSLGTIYSATDLYEKALQCYTKALNIRESVWGDNHPYVATEYNNIGNIYIYQNKYNEALQAHLRSLDICLSTFGENHTTVAETHNNIGVIYELLGEYDEALIHYQKTLDIYLNLYDENSQHVASTYSNLVSIYDYKGEYEKAMECAMKSLEIRKELYGEKHPDVADCYTELGILYAMNGNLTSALEYFFKSLEIEKLIFGENGLKVATSYLNIGSLYYDQGDLDSALEYYYKSLSIRLPIYGENHTKVASCYSNIGAVFDDRGEWDKALEYYMKSLNIRLQILGDSHPNVATNYYNLGLVYYKQNDFLNALDCLNHALPILENTLGTNHTKTINTQEIISEIQTKLKEQENEQKIEK